MIRRALNVEAETGRLDLRPEACRLMPNSTRSLALMSHTMRTTTLAALLLGSFLAATSCRTVERRPLPPPGPPAPPAPEPANPPSPHREQRAAPPEGATADPSFLAVVYRWDTARR